MNEVENRVTKEDFAHYDEVSRLPKWFQYECMWERMKLLIQLIHILLEDPTLLTLSNTLLQQTYFFPFPQCVVLYLIVKLAFVEVSLCCTNIFSNTSDANMLYVGRIVSECKIRDSENKLRSVDAEK